MDEKEKGERVEQTLLANWLHLMFLIRVDHFHDTCHYDDFTPSCKLYNY